MINDNGTAECFEKLNNHWNAKNNFNSETSDGQDSNLYLKCISFVNIFQKINENLEFSSVFVRSVISLMLCFESLQVSN